MADVVLQMAVMILAGIAWRIIRPAKLDADLTRHVIASLVYYVLLPALVLEVLSRHALGVETLRIAAFGATLIFAGVALAWLAYRWLPAPDSQRGAAILAVAFPNVTFLGLPVLEQTFGPWARAVAIQIDLFACMPLVLTLAVTIAGAYGSGGGKDNGAWRALLSVPALWAVLAAALLNHFHITLPAWLAGALGRMSGTVAPLMLFALGLGLRLDALRWRNIALLAPVLALRLLLLPLLAWPLASALHFGGDTWRALILEAAMPSMVVGIVLCDRFRLDSGFYAAAVTLTTLASWLSLPFWWRLFQAVA
ncbi:AEC family transporter [Methylogaea oryzae]|uniref:Transporter n=2 Tax=Methylogaea oryzae TaxID=1295382 RepID=A0A8D5AL61_9GAMM|nr:AEC family transporter [Methylogaea oryzae]BBL69840.1 transporter [Methylogaea oryzae]